MHLHIPFEKLFQRNTCIIHPLPANPPPSLYCNKHHLRTKYRWLFIGAKVVVGEVEQSAQLV